ncbi:hypothetical protein KBZ10_02875 [Streptomyces sp. F63]|uniref:hypothetical protein n=1 Tax=Streptomyces sp. F63 TaxID=2824887 RepID=UPI001B369089|nr:hypothetical protein [Streptomyces sp. F63]MBQ0983493.1 hypothetical protein [Streptomyces sp. F63]
MTGEAAVWHRLAALLPPEEAREFEDFWSIGEQEAGLELLVSSLSRRQVVIDETTRAEIAVVCEAWGMWPRPLGPVLAQCPGEGSGSAVRLIEDATRAPLPGAAAGLRDQLLLVPWIRCTGCGRVLARAHIREPWGDLSCAPEEYVILNAALSDTLRLFGPGNGWDALTALRTCCERPGGPSPAPSHKG